MKTIIQLAKEMQEQMTASERKDENKTRYYHLKDGHADWMQDVIHEAHGDRMPDDDVYSRISTILDTLADLDDDADEDTIRERLDEIEPDVYTNDVTAWLHSRSDNVYYLTEALEEFEVKDGFQLLAYAQKRYIDEIANALMTALQNHAEAEAENAEIS